MLSGRMRYKVDLRHRFSKGVISCESKIDFSLSLVRVPIAMQEELKMHYG